MISPSQGQQAQGRNCAGPSWKVTVAATAISLTAHVPCRNVFFIYIHMYMCSFTRTAPVGIDQHTSSQRSALYMIFIYPFQSYRAAQPPGLSSGAKTSAGRFDWSTGLGEGQSGCAPAHLLGRMPATACLPPTAWEGSFLRASAASQRLESCLEPPLRISGLGKIPYSPFLPRLQPSLPELQPRHHEKKTTKKPT